MHMPLLISLIVLSLSLLAFADEPATTEPLAATRIVCLGDSITDGHTHPLLIQQALAEAGKPVPVMINAGIGGDNATGMAGRLDRDVFVHEPDLVMLSTAINDLHGKTVEEFERAYRAILEGIKARQIPVMVFTSSMLAARHSGAQMKLDQFNGVIRKLAVEYGCVLAEVDGRFKETPEDAKLWEDGAHLSFEGYRVLTRAALDAMGYADVPVPAEWKIDPCPGLVTHWRIKPLAKREPLTPETAADIDPARLDDAWKTYEVPEKEPVGGWWEQQQQARGVAWAMAEKLGPAEGFVALAVVTSDAEKQVYVNTGAGTGPVWVNGVHINPNPPVLGYHLGGQRIPVTLKPGDNVILVETGGKLFLSVTDDNKW